MFNFRTILLLNFNFLQNGVSLYPENLNFIFTHFEYACLICKNRYRFCVPSPQLLKICWIFRFLLGSLGILGFFRAPQLRFLKVNRVPLLMVHQSLLRFFSVSQGPLRVPQGFLMSPKGTMGSLNFLELRFMRVCQGSLEFLGFLRVLGIMELNDIQSCSFLQIKTNFRSFLSCYDVNFFKTMKMCHQVSEIQCMSDPFCVGRKKTFVPLKILFTLMFLFSTKVHIVARICFKRNNFTQGLSIHDVRWWWGRRWSQPNLISYLREH